MKVKKVFVCFLFICISLATVLTVFAHSGRTDANGGHWNHATGEYHYHSGKYAGKSNSSSNSSSSSSSNSKLEEWKARHSASSTASQETSTKNYSKDIWEAIKAIFIISAIVLFPFWTELISKFVDFFKKRKK